MLFIPILFLENTNHSSAIIENSNNIHNILTIHNILCTYHGFINSKHIWRATYQRRKYEVNKLLVFQAFM